MPLYASARTRAILGVIAVTLSGATSAKALTIKPIFDSSITSLANAATVEAAFDTVANEFDAAFTTPVTVKIGVSWGAVDGLSLPSGDISASHYSLTGPYYYSDIVGAFHDDAAANPGDANMVSAAAHLPATSPAGSLPYELPYAQAQALGFLPASIYADSGYVGFSSTVKWEFAGAKGVTAGAYDFEGLAAHEISEVLGRTTGLTSAHPTYATMFDVLRYSASGTHSFSYTSPAYFSVNGGVTDLDPFNASGGGDRSDLLSVKGDAQDAFLATDTAYGLSTADLTALDVLGWGSWTTGDGSITIGGLSTSGISAAMGTPEPSTWAMLLLGLGLVGGLRRRAPIPA